MINYELHFPIDITSLIITRSNQELHSQETQFLWHDFYDDYK